MLRAHRLFLFALLAQELPVSMLRHPAGAGEMTVMDTSSSLRLGSGIDAENDCNCFAPVGAIGGRVENAHIELRVLTVIVGEHRTLWRRVLIIGWFHFHPLDAILYPLLRTMLRIFPIGLPLNRQTEDAGLAAALE